MTSYEDQMEQQADGEYTAEIKARKEAAKRQATFRVTRTWRDGEADTDHVRYADAASLFWQFVAMMPDDGHDVYVYNGKTRWSMRRQGRDFTRGGAAWEVRLEVVQ